MKAVWILIKVCSLHQFSQINIQKKQQNYLIVVHFTFALSILQQQINQQFQQIPMSMRKIDPMIMETLNLNPKRLSHIHQILHDEKPNKQISSKVIKKNHSFHNTHRQKNKNHSTLLPELNRKNQTLQTSKSNNRNGKQYDTLLGGSTRRIKVLSHRQKANGGKVDDNSSPIAKIEKRRTIDDSVVPISQRNFEPKSQKINSQPRKSLSTVRSKFISNKKSPLQTPSQIEPSSKLSQPDDEVIRQESLVGKLQKQTIQTKSGNQRVKTKQLLNDYMGSLGLKRSKSMNLNPKDICRMQVQKIVGQLTPIQKLEDAEKKMKRIKRRHQNLAHFDQKYYSRLNEIDFQLLQNYQSTQKIHSPQT